MLQCSHESRGKRGVSEEEEGRSETEAQRDNEEEIRRCEEGSMV